MKKSGFIDSVRVKQPCTEDWNEMTGNDQVRFCSHCAKSVNNISEMTRKKALGLVRRSRGDLCIRYLEHPVTKAPVFAAELVQIARRASRVAAGVMTASLSLTALAYAQGGAASKSDRDGSPVAEKSANPSTASIPPSGSISGTVMDPAGAVIPGSSVKLLDAKANEIRNLTTDQDGKYEFTELPNGVYEVHVESQHFVKSVRQGVEVAGRPSSIDVELQIGNLVALGGVVATSREFEGLLAGAVAADDLEEVQNLISRGENVNRREEDKTTPLFIAVENGNIEIVRILLEAGARVNARDASRDTPLMQVDDDATPELVQLRIRYGAKVELANKDGDTALIRAAEYSTAEVVKALIDAAAKVDIQNKEGDTALMKSAYAEDLEKVKLLVIAGANVKLRNKNGDSAWDQSGVEEIENFLVVHGAEIPEVLNEPITEIP